MIEEKKGANIVDISDDIDNQHVEYEGEMNRYLNYQQKLLKRYFVLNNRALLLYKDNTSYNAHPKSPTHIVPLAEIVNVSARDSPISIRGANETR